MPNEAVLRTRLALSASQDVKTISAVVVARGWDEQATSASLLVFTIVLSTESLKEGRRHRPLFIGSRHRMCRQGATRLVLEFPQACPEWESRLLLHSSREGYP